MINYYLSIPFGTLTVKDINPYDFLAVLQIIQWESSDSVTTSLDQKNKTDKTGCL